MKKKKNIFEDSTKTIYTTDKEGKLIVKFSDEVPLKSPHKTVVVKGKGAINNQIAAFLYKYLSSFHINTNFVNVNSDKEMIVQQLKAIPIEIVVHNFVDKDLADRFGLEECSSLNSPIQEFFLKTNRRPMVNQTHLQALGIVEPDEFRMIERFTSKINAILRSFFQRRKLQLVRFRLEYGKLNDKIVFASDLTPDTMNLADLSSGEPNFDRFRLTASKATDIYFELKERILQQ